MDNPFRVAASRACLRYSTRPTRRLLTGDIPLAASCGVLSSSALRGEWVAGDMKKIIGAPNIVVKEKIGFFWNAVYFCVEEMLLLNV